MRKQLSRIEFDICPQHSPPSRRAKINLVKEERSSKRSAIEVRCCMNAIEALFAYIDGEREVDAIKDAIFFIKPLERANGNG